MKLIDLLVQHLGSKGGWPSGAGVCAQDNDGEVCFYTEKGIHRRNGRAVWSIPEGVQSKLVKRRIFFIPAEDMITSVVCLEQYEAALAASKQPVWSGEGLPPVGTECEWLASGDHDWMRVKVLAYHEDEVWLQPLNGAQSFTVGNPDDFRPIRTEAERKREEFAKSLCDYLDDLTEWDSPVGKVHAMAIYDAIAAGEIRGVKLDLNDEA